MISDLKIHKAFIYAQRNRVRTNSTPTKSCTRQHKKALVRVYLLEKLWSQFFTMAQLWFCLLCWIRSAENGFQKISRFMRTFSLALYPHLSENKSWLNTVQATLLTLVGTAWQGTRCMGNTTHQRIQGAWPGPPLPPRLFSNSCSFQARGKTPILSKFVAQAPPLGQNSAGSTDQNPGSAPDLKTLEGAESLIKRPDNWTEMSSSIGQLILCLLSGCWTQLLLKRCRV